MREGVQRSFMPHVMLCDVSVCVYAWVGAITFGPQMLCKHILVTPNMHTFPSSGAVCALTLPTHYRIHCRKANWGGYEKEPDPFQLNYFV